MKIIKTTSRIRKIKKIKEKTCGKLYIGGEYSILTPYQSAIIKNINIFMNCEIFFSETKEYKIKSDMYDYAVNLEYDKNYLLIIETINIMNEYIILKGMEVFPFEISITGKMEKYGKKYGIGSSGSVVILVIKAMCKLYNIKISKELIFKLSSYILLKIGDNGSMGDLACIAYEDLILYTSFDREKIRDIIEKNTLEEVLRLDWEYKIEKIKSSKKYDFLVGWTKEPSISKDMIDKVKKSINKKYLDKTEVYIQNLKKSIETDNKIEVKKNINKISELLIQLDTSIYSDKLIKLVKTVENYDACAKSSGAGGGDCGIAISFSRTDSENIIEKWKKVGIELLYSEKL
ncbi:MAG: phosphomevalonate kinase [Leptotrichiaceae bacterium]|nr:phosphomevalonate kinase [Leptotrichiaceae bacterium]MBP6281561.1 phosphomevalonate kinase [Leptotrichiaceae bacterium]MBP7100773.1 phosphomevalonate kinase [Leptotrichiaceae bacterium]MBP7739297.1 phosphomevalonate kinase [Leptotrichiaceae bacterium]